MAEPRRSGTGSIAIGYGQIPEPEEVRAFVDKLAGAQSLTVELSNYRYETQKLEFQLEPADTRNVADRFRKDCGDILREEAEIRPEDRPASSQIRAWEGRIMISTSTRYQIITKDLARTKALIEKDPATKREIEYYQANIKSIKTIDEFIKNDRTLQVRHEGLWP